MKRYVIRKGEKIPEIERGNYLIRLSDEKIVISPLPYEVILKKIKDFSYFLNNISKKIYDSEKAKALEDFIIEEIERIKSLN